MKRLQSAIPDCLLVVCIACALIWPLFRLEYLNNWASIESTFIADARMLKEHLPHTGWQPLWYGGTRFDYVYPPALRYGTALISKFAHVSTARGYHLYTAFFYVFGLLAVYWLVRVGSGSRVTALLSSFAAALLSPSFLLMPSIARDSGFHVPQRLHVLTAYGEGPHVTALCVLTAALAASFFALRKWRPGAFVAAAILCALTVANNFYGATSLAIFFPVMVWAVWNGERDSYVWLRAAGIAGLAYGLSAFWLTPSYVWITLTDLKWVAQPGNAGSDLIALLVVGAFCTVSFVLGRGRVEREWAVFVAGAAVLLSLNVLGAYYFGFRVTGDTARLIPELDLALILAFFELIRILWPRESSGRASHSVRFALVLLVLAAFFPSVRYLQHVWSPFPANGPLENQYEYRIAKWVHEALPGERVLPSGSVRFWFDAWFDNQQIDGGSMQGMLNQNIPPATFQIMKGSQPELSILWMQAMGTDAVVVPDNTSPEPYKDFAHPEKFRSALPVLYDDRAGTTIYRIPRIHPGIGRIVSKQAISESGKIMSGDDADALKKYLKIVENPVQPVTNVTWRGFDAVEVNAEIAEGQAVLLQETYDPSWHAYADGKEVLVMPEPVMGFMLIEAPSGRKTIELLFETPFENRRGQVVALLSLLVCASLTLTGLRKGVRSMG